MIPDGVRVKRHIHYEVAFEDYLRRHQIPYVAVDEAKRAAFRDVRLKSFDFVVYSAGPTNWLVDIKGRRYQPSHRNGQPAWENWVTQDDLDALTQWEQLFGRDFAALLVFAYRAEPPAHPPPEIVHRYDGASYVLAAIDAATYRQHARVRSPKWGTVCMPRALFAHTVRPIAELL